MKKEMGRQFRRIRRSRGESQAEVAARLGASQQLVSAIERGRSTIDHMMQACRALGIAGEIRIGDEVFPVAHAMDPRERREIEANLDWFSRLSPGDRLRTMHRQYLVLMKLRANAAAALPRGRRGA
jgi:transcriptional regulator with XRE-family HTH domain